MYICNQCKCAINVPRAVRRYQKKNKATGDDKAYCACSNYIYRICGTWYGMTHTISSIPSRPA